MILIIVPSVLHYSLQVLKLFDVDLLNSLTLTQRVLDVCKIKFDWSNASMDGAQYLVLTFAPPPLPPGPSPHHRAVTAKLPLQRVVFGEGRLLVNFGLYSQLYSISHHIVA